MDGADSPGAWELGGQTEALLRDFGIELEDLVANRAGRLTARQSRMLRANGTRDLLGGGVIALLLGLVLLAAAPLAPVQVVLGSLLAFAGFALGVVRFVRYRAAAAAGRCMCLEGPIAVLVSGRAGARIVVSGRSFKLPIHAWRVQNGARYGIYFAPGIDRIVAIEPF